MPTPPTKTALYETMAASVAQHWARDAAWCDAADPRWDQARTLDAALVAGRTEDTVTLLAYRKLVTRLSLLYTQGASS